MDGEFRNCLIDLDGEGLVGKFKALHSELNRPFGLKKISETAMVKYIVAAYDKNSPYMERHFDLVQRRRHSAKYAQFPVEDGRYIEEAEIVLNGDNNVINELITYYLYCQHDIDFTNLQLYQQMHLTQTKIVMTQGVDKPADFDKLKSNIEALTKKIKDGRAFVTHNEVSETLLKRIYGFIDEISTDIRPEDRAKRLENNEPVVDVNPYGSYEPKALRFLDDE